MEVLPFLDSILDRHSPSDKNKNQLIEKLKYYWDNPVIPIEYCSRYNCEIVELLYSDLVDDSFNDLKGEILYSLWLYQLLPWIKEIQANRIEQANQRMVLSSHLPIHLILPLTSICAQYI